jgi:hypothetical protein
MRRVFRTTIIALNMVALAAFGAHAADEGSTATLPGFLERYHPALHRIQAVYYKLRMDEHQTSRPGHRKPPLDDMRLRWLPRGIGRQHRFDLLEPDGSVRTAKVLTADGSFAARRTAQVDGESGKAVFRYADVRPASEEEAFLKASMVWIRTPFAAYTVYEEPIDQWLSDPERRVKVTGFSEYQEAGIRKARLSFVMLFGDKPCSGYFIFAPDAGYVLLAYADESPLGLRINVEYGEPVDGIPTVKRVAYRSRKYGDQPYLIAETTGVQSGPAPAEMFGPDAFGLPDLRKQERGGLFLLPLGIAGLLIALALAAILRRRNPAAVQAAFTAEP